ncbi:hypothetical protein GQ53DRAFT_152878 [Thozetella sp. PMI_491]|nr:hypothetical protein GQ53DRAFT_152878 [Thozetella sp. PMI_491]
MPNKSWAAEDPKQKLACAAALPPFGEPTISSAIACIIRRCKDPSPSPFPLYHDMQCRTRKAVSNLEIVAFWEMAMDQDPSRSFSLSLVHPAPLCMRVLDFLAPWENHSLPLPSPQAQPTTMSDSAQARTSTGVSPVLLSTYLLTYCHGPSTHPLSWFRVGGLSKLPRALASGMAACHTDAAYA